MDETRIIRYITPTLIFLGSLLLGRWLGDSCLPQIPFGYGHGNVAIVAGEIGTVLFTMGFIITGLSTMFLEGAFYFSKHCYQIALTDDAWKQVWTVLGLSDAVGKTKRNKVSAGLTFDHEIIHKRVHASAVRLWTTFNIAVNSCTALILAFFVGHCALRIPCNCWWLFITLFLVVLFGWTAVMTWRSHMNLIEIQVHRSREQNGLIGD